MAKQIGEDTKVTLDLKTIGIRSTKDYTIYKVNKDNEIFKYNFTINYI